MTMRLILLLLLLVFPVGSRANESVTSENFNITQTIVTLTAATSNNFLAKNTERKFLIIMNVGANPATIAPGTAAVTVGNGVNLDPPATTANQGGNLQLDALRNPQSALSAISTGGTKLCVWEGF